MLGHIFIFGKKGWRKITLNEASSIVEVRNVVNKESKENRKIDTGKTETKFKTDVERN